MKKILAVVLALTIMCSAMVVMPIMASTAQNETAESIAEKTSKALDENGRFELEIQVPGGDGKEYHDEIIIMVDGSYSTDDDWPTVRTAILEIGKTVLEGSGNTLLTLMTFGMGDNIVLKHVMSVEELDATLTELPGGLLYGRSSTNCEAGFTGVGEYIDSHDGTLNEVHVVYITDGGINTDETEYTFYNWTVNTWLKKDPITLVKMSLAEECAGYALGAIALSNAYKTVFGDTIYTADQVMADGVISDEDLMAWADQVWADVYAYSGMNAETAYAVSDAERAFVKYDKENGTHVQEMFYYALWGRKYPNSGTRTPEAGLNLAAHAKVAHLYMVDSNAASSWMSNMANTASNISFHEAGKMSNLLTALQGVLTNLAYTPYNDVIVTDYMSKWVNLDSTTIKVVDNYAGITIWTSDEGWLISESRPTSQEIPVIVEEVPADAYAEGGPNVKGNENGTIYKLTWYVKEGAMLRNHNYSLIYEVDVDTEENGFKYDTEYPANGKTTIDYIEKNGDDITEKTENIPVPEVIVDQPELPETSAPETSEPETSAPETSEPETSEPETSEPETSEPETSEPETSEPETSAPETSEPETSAPETSEPETSEPETSAPETSEPETSEPETSEPETSEPETSAPETSEPETSEPETSEPETSEPETSEPETSEPETSEPETSAPETSEPESSENTDVPDTGNDSLSHIAIYVAVAILSLVGLIGIVCHLSKEGRKG